MFAELLAELLEWCLDIKFWFKKRKRRKFEKAHNIPKKTMWYPSQKLGVLYLMVMLFSAIIFMVFVFPNIKNNNTKKRLSKIVMLLEKEKKEIGAYPIELKTIIRNNPLLKGITKDDWKNEFYYKLSDDGLTYNLFSLGKDNTPNTDDDITLKQ
ncbi:type II secretion system protein GspG [Psychroserpens sp. AS72]|uniref:type II secretion system protein GspG n=1 Tax=Psychroserpens sp. AS72 TaxID=3135775 RepID=UPI00317A7579